MTTWNVVYNPTATPVLVLVTDHPYADDVIPAKGFGVVDTDGARAQQLLGRGHLVIPDNIYTKAIYYWSPAAQEAIRKRNLILGYEPDPEPVVRDEYEGAVFNGDVDINGQLTINDVAIEDLVGAPGQDGDPGAPGSDGLSAYEVAVANGFSGTQSEWLTSLAGVSGLQARRTVPPSSHGCTVVTSFASGHGFALGGSYNASSNVNQSTTGSRNASQQVALITDAAGGTGTLTKTGATPLSLATHNARIWLKTSNQQQIGLLAVRVASAGGLSGGNYGEWILAGTSVATTSLGANQQEITNNNVLTGFDLSPADLTITGSPDLTAITEWQIRFADRNNGQGAQTITLNGIDAPLKGTNGLGDDGVLILTFDDSMSGQGTFARQVLNSRGVQGTFMLIADFLGQTNAMTATQAKALYLDGHEIAGHAYAKTVHDNITSTSQANAEADFRLLSAWLSDNGYPNASFAFPSGYFYPNNDPSRLIFDCARTTLKTLKHNTIPMTDLYRVRSITQVGGVGGYATATITGSGGDLEKAQANNSALCLTFHQITSGAAAAALECSQADLAAIVDKAQTLGMTVMTLGQYARAVRNRQPLGVS